MKFYTSDWRADPRLKMCSPAARGMWIEMICLMHEATPYGHLLIHGQSPNEAQLASLTGIHVAELPGLVAELERLGVFSRTREGVIYSRKLVRMASKSAKARKNGKQGGNPTLGKQTQNAASLNLQDNGQDKPQKPEARYQKEEIGKPISCASKPSFSPQDFQDFWDAFPHRNGKKKNRQGAEAAFSKAIRSGVSVAQIAQGVADMFRDPEVRRGYARDPTTWLNQKGWTDEIPDIPQGGTHERNHYNAGTSQGRQNRPDPALEQIARLAGIGTTPGYGGR